MALWNRYTISNEFMVGESILVCNDHGILPVEIGGIQHDYYFKERKEVSGRECCYFCDKIASEV